MIHLALKPTRIDVLIFIRIDQTNSGLKIILKLTAVFTQIMKQAQEFPLLVQPNFSGERLGNIGNLEQVFI
ncbi:MAG: hypothetical protein A2X36_14975 [Elusimicrobia bacterium GWA2_69_24]|nr:MAG: hypothetical protein A2X36_14975 [Elusimicrobia bacterium GWA2_69_24]